MSRLQLAPAEAGVIASGSAPKNCHDPRYHQPKDMRRFLLIAFAYPPVEIVGSVRPAALAKYLPRYGWEALVLTPKRQVARESDQIIETGYRDVLGEWKARLGLDRRLGVHQQLGLATAKKPGSRLKHTRLLTFAKYLLTYPDPFKGWIPFALEAIEEIRRQKLDISAIITTSPPISCHLIGRHARNILGCPWIADLRDLWTQNLGEQNFQQLQGRLEKRTLKDADALVTVSQPWAERLQTRYPEKKIFTIPNGFDPDDYRSPAPALTREFSITYTGELYQGQRDPTRLFEVLSDLLKEGSMLSDDLRVRFYGAVEPWLPLQVEKFGLTQVVELHGPTQRKRVFEHQRESQLLLALPWSDPRETGHHSAKLFEYLAARRPVLAVGGTRGVLTEALEQTQAGTHATSKTQVREFLLAAYAEYKKQGHVSYGGNSQAIAQYSHPEMARSFGQVLDGVAVTEKSLV
jgi:glycosyltransferase involved in cell wall biosynthesis